MFTDELNPKTKPVGMRGTPNTKPPCSVVNEESTDRATRELWESGISSFQRVEAWKDEQLKEPERGTC